MPDVLETSVRLVGLGRGSRERGSYEVRRAAAARISLGWQTLPGLWFPMWHGNTAAGLKRRRIWTDLRLRWILAALWPNLGQKRRGDSRRLLWRCPHGKTLAGGAEQEWNAWRYLGGIPCGICCALRQRGNSRVTFKKFWISHAPNWDGEAGVVEGEGRWFAFGDISVRCLLDGPSRRWRRQWMCQWQVISNFRVETYIWESEVW